MDKPASRRRFLQSACGCGAALLGGCSPATIVNALVPANTYRRASAISYGPHPRQRLDVYRPVSQVGPRPVVVFFYGGSWKQGERASYLFAGEALASREFVAVIPDYRLYPEVRFPDFLTDCAAAVRWTMQHAQSHGGDPARVVLMGHSAGAYNAAMLAFDPTYLAQAQVDRRNIRALVGLAGPYDFLPARDAVTRGVFGYPDTPINTQPIHFVTSQGPPSMVVTGGADDIVDPGNSRRFATRLRAQGVTTRELVYPGIGHADLVGALAAPLRRIAPVLEDVTAFLRDLTAVA